MITQCRTRISDGPAAPILATIFVVLTIVVLSTMPAKVNAQDAAVVGDDNYELALADMMTALAEEMAVIRVTQDPAERWLLMEEHQNGMREALVFMRGMGGETMQTVMSAHLSDQEEITREKANPVHRHKQITGGSRTEIVSSQLVDLELRLDMMQVVLESLVEQCAVQ